jgi:fumarate hydratase subunit alpha
VRKIEAEKIIWEVSRICEEANYQLEESFYEKLKEAKIKETNPKAKEVLDILIKNAQIAQTEKIPLCQDTGYAIFFVQLGENIQIDGKTIQECITEGVRIGYKKGNLRKSIVKNPIYRENTKDNTPPIIHIDVVPGENIRMKFLPKGGGGENASYLWMLNPTDGEDKIVETVLNHIKKVGVNACPPFIVGIGLGGTFDTAAYLAKKALLRKTGTKNTIPKIVELEDRLLKEINGLGIGPAGLGGDTTAIAVNIECYPTHIACLPLAINLGCCAHRLKEITI